MMRTLTIKEVEAWSKRCPRERLDRKSLYELAKRGAVQVRKDDRCETVDVVPTPSGIALMKTLGLSPHKRSFRF
jgi:hypothetical protein